MAEEINNVATGVSQQEVYNFHYPFCGGEFFVHRQNKQITKEWTAAINQLANAVEIAPAKQWGLIAWINVVRFSS